MDFSGVESKRVEEVSPIDVAGWLRGGAVAIVPTETVYGLAVAPGNASALRRVFDLKGRPVDMNLPVVIGAVDQLGTLGVDFNATGRLLADRYWPGPLTLVMGFTDAPRPDWLAGRVEVAIRFPEYRFLRDIALMAGPLLLTSANGHGAGPKQVAAEAAASLHGAVDVVIDGGTLAPLPSTIINTRHVPARVERLGAVSVTHLDDLIRGGTVVVE